MLSVECISVCFQTTLTWSRSASVSLLCCADLFLRVAFGFVCDVCCIVVSYPETLARLCKEDEQDQRAAVLVDESVQGR